MAPVQKLGNVDTKKRTSQKVAFGIFTLLSYLVVVILFLILGFIIIQGGKVISWDFLTEAPADGMTAGGIFPAIVGTLYLVLGSSLISFPIGIMSGIYMNEYATNGKIIRFIRIMTNNLSGVPSVVFGLFGMSLFVVTLGWGDSIIAGSFTLALMSLPLIIRTTEEALKSIDDSFRHGSLALGATKLQTIRRVVLPMAYPVYRTCIRRDGSYPVYRCRLLPAPAAGKHLRPVYGPALSSVCYFHQRNRHRSLAWNGLRNGSGTDCNRINRKLTGQCAERLFRQKSKNELIAYTQYKE